MHQRQEAPALSPADAFDLLGNETRLAIIQALAERRRTNWRMDGLRFAELRKAVGVRDAGTFSYHLDELRGRFVTKDGEEYVLTQRGLDVADAVLSGMYGETGIERRAPVDLPCPECDRGLAGVYDEGLVGVTCEEHGMLVASSLPPGAVTGRPMDEVIAVAMRDMQQDVEMALEGVCMHCWGRMHGALVTEPPVEHPATGEVVDADSSRDQDPPKAAFGCERCGTVFWTEPGGTLLRRPAVVSFYHDHGIDVMGQPFVSEHVIEGFDGQEILDDDRVAVSMALDGDALTVTLDGDLSVVDVERDGGS